MKDETREMVNRIESDMRKLLELIGEDYISAWISNGCFSIVTEIKDDETQTLNIFRNEVSI